MIVGNIDYPDEYIDYFEYNEDALRICEDCPYRDDREIGKCLCCKVCKHYNYRYYCIKCDAYSDYDNFLNMVFDKLAEIEGKESQ